jgi:hypothetical protein
VKEKEFALAAPPQVTLNPVDVIRENTRLVGGDGAGGGGPVVVAVNGAEATPLGLETFTVNTIRV